jgi:hypothetical protein
MEGVASLRRGWALNIRNLKATAEAVRKTRDRPQGDPSRTDSSSTEGLQARSLKTFFGGAGRPKDPKN